MADPPKRVLLMASSMRGGGSERQVLLLAQRLDRRLFRPHLYLTESAGDFLSNVPHDVPIHSFDQCPNHSAIYFPGRELRRQTGFLKEVITEHQIDIVYDRTFHMTMLAGQAAIRTRRVSTIVSPPHLALPLVEQRFVALKRRRLAAAYRSSDVVVAVSKQAADSAETYYNLDPESVFVVKNPVNASELRDSLGSDPRVESNETQLVCVGRMTAEKGHADLIDALAIVASRWPLERGKLQVFMIGDGPLRASLESQARASDLASIIHFVGAKADAVAIIAKSDALVLPSHFEGMPNVVLESMAVGTPVIATRSGGTVELEKDEPTIFWAQPRAPESIADAILKFAQSPTIAEQHCSAASRLIETDHSIDQYMHRIESLLLGTPET